MNRASLRCRRRHGRLGALPRPRTLWIVADIPGTHVGGMRRHMLLHARGMEQLGWRVRLVFAEDGARSGSARVDGWFSGARLLAGMRGLLRRDPPDVVNVHTLAAPSWILARRAGLLRSRVVVMSYAADERALPPGPSLARLRLGIPARALFRCADGVWCVNEEDARFHRQTYGVPPSRLRVIPHAVEDTFRNPPPPTAPRGPSLLFVGSWIPRKGIAVVVPTLSHCLRASRSCRATVAGVGGDPARIRALFDASVRDRVTVLPSVDDAELGALYRDAALLLVPSQLEGLPFSLLEAMASGCPALAANNSGMRDVIEDGRNGWLLDGFDPSAWARKAAELLADPVRLAAAGAQGRNDSARFDLSRLSAEARDWYEEIVLGAEQRG